MYVPDDQVKPVSTVPNIGVENEAYTENEKEKRPNETNDDIGHSLPSQINVEIPLKHTENTARFVGYEK